MPSMKSGLHDNCSEALVKSVATEMLSNGMKEAGYNRINLDDCWGATDLEGNRADSGRYDVACCVSAAEPHDFDEPQGCCGGTWSLHAG